MTDKRSRGRPPKVELPATPSEYGEGTKPPAGKVPKSFRALSRLGPLSLSVRDVVELTALARSCVYRDIKSGKLPAKKSGARTIVLMSDLQTYIDNLPSAS
jgi:predicted DNA-binding transcriptional regulator AlpA